MSEWKQGDSLLQGLSVAKNLERRARYLVPPSPGEPLCAKGLVLAVGEALEEVNVRLLALEKK